MMTLNCCACSVLDSTGTSPDPRGRPAQAAGSCLHRRIGRRGIDAAQDPGEPVSAVFDFVAGVIVRIRIHVHTPPALGYLYCKKSRPAVTRATPRTPRLPTS